MHICTKCNITKPISDFPPANDRPMGIRNQCRVCTKILHTNDRHLREYNLTPIQVENLVKSQENCCKICNRTFDKVKRAIDHDHKTGLVRGLLCNPCNTGLGKFADNPMILERAAAYLKGTL